MLRRLISIHAPAKGATSLPPYTDTFAVFQSTLPRRERLRSAPHALHGFNFNPRSREGSDGYVLRILHSSGISIHAPAKGATSFRIRIAIFRDYFNPRSREGSDGTRDSFIDLAGYFNPRSREGSDNGIVASYTRPLDFNPRSREGSDPQCKTL